MSILYYHPALVKEPDSEAYTRQTRISGRATPHAMKRPQRPCIDCGTLTTHTRCPTCTPKHHAHKHRWDNTRNPHYRTHAWHKARTQALAAGHNQCATCATTTTLQVHHIDHVADGTHDTPDNLIPLCARCHQRLEAEYQRGDTDGPTHTLLAEALAARSGA